VATPSQAPATTRTSQDCFGSTAASCRVRAVADDPDDLPDLDAAEPELRPAGLPGLLFEFPLGAEEVRVAIPATVPDAGPKTPDFRGREAAMLRFPGLRDAGRAYKTASPAGRAKVRRGGPGRPS
jgi:hypothetical protein